MKILLIEDDAMIGNSLKVGLVSGGHTVDWIRDGKMAGLALRDPDCDIVLLDLSLPGCDGLTLLRELRSRRHAVPVLILTARADISDRVAGLDLGADDYLTKPFALEELEARLRALSRRQGPHTDAKLVCGPVELNASTKEVHCHGEPVALTRREYQILAALIQRPGAIISKIQLLEKMCDLDRDIDSNVVEVYIHQLRQKLAPGLIHTVRGLGYQLVCE